MVIQGESEIVDDDSVQVTECLQAIVDTVSVISGVFKCHSPASPASCLLISWRGNLSYSVSFIQQ